MGSVLQIGSLVLGDCITLQHTGLDQTVRQNGKSFTNWTYNHALVADSTGNVVYGSTIGLVMFNPADAFAADKPFTVTQLDELSGIEDFSTAMGLLLGMIGAMCALSIVGTVCFLKGAL